MPTEVQARKTGEGFKSKLEAVSALTEHTNNTDRLDKSSKYIFLAQGIELFRLEDI